MSCISSSCCCCCSFLSLLKFWPSFSQSFGKLAGKNRRKHEEQSFGVACSRSLGLEIVVVGSVTLHNSRNIPGARNCGPLETKVNNSPIHIQQGACSQPGRARAHSYMTHATCNCLLLNACYACIRPHLRHQYISRGRQIAQGDTRPAGTSIEKDQQKPFRNFL